jgi:hypothetical protein
MQAYCATDRIALQLRQFLEARLYDLSNREDGMSSMALAS